MTDFFLILNLLFAYLSWKWAMDAFENGFNKLGWMQIFISALNMAAALDKIL